MADHNPVVEKRGRGRPKRHGLARTPTYNQWAGMKQSCNNTKARLYPYIGAKGIGYVKRWDSFENFVADMGEKPEGATLQRRDRTKSFSPANCFWQTPKDAAAGGKSKPTSDGNS
jgi:hypothetical protein